MLTVFFSFSSQTYLWKSERRPDASWPWAGGEHQVPAGPGSPWSKSAESMPMYIGLLATCSTFMIHRFLKWCLGSNFPWAQFLSETILLTVWNLGTLFSRSFDNVLWLYEPFWNLGTRFSWLFDMFCDCSSFNQPPLPLLPQSNNWSLVHVVWQYF